MMTYENGIKFENVYIYWKTLEQPKYIMFKKILNEVPDVNLFKLHENDTVVASKKALPNSNFIFHNIIFKSQNIIRSYFLRSRYNKIYVCYLAQSYLYVPK